MNVILESEPINIPNAKKCRVNHGLVDREGSVFKRNQLTLTRCVLKVWKNKKLSLQKSNSRIKMIKFLTYTR